MNLLIAVVLTAVIMGLGWVFFAVLGAALRWADVFPVVPFPAPAPGPRPGHCPCCGCAVVLVACDGGGVAGDGGGC